MDDQPPFAHLAPSHPYIPRPGLGESGRSLQLIGAYGGDGGDGGGGDGGGGVGGGEHHSLFAPTPLWWNSTF